MSSEIVITSPGFNNDESLISTNWTLYVHDKFNHVLNWKLEDFIKKHDQDDEINTSSHNEISEENHKSIVLLLNLIDSNMNKAWSALDKIDWGSHQGTYNDLKAEWIDPPHGFSKSHFRSRLKVFINTHWK